MMETAAHLAEHAFPLLPVRQWVLAAPKRLRYFQQRDAAVQGALRIFLRAVERSPHDDKLPVAHPACAMPAPPRRSE
jgi:hypothetical protein